MEHFGPKKGASSKLWIRCKNVLQILDNGKGQQVDESKNNGLYLKKTVQDKETILGPQMAHPDYSGSAPIILKKFCRMKDGNRYMKILLFFGKKFHLGQNDLFNLQVTFYCLNGHGRN